ncbi:hypothetical protein LSM04_001560 [Trypanosoma melophagium]|uniref:uncharacterized protein n=1 Tax=Trypanosoma melophagium TaxID=715481 RepID=UPI00351A6478|nr:hypothetical protein LSM04_001560 [Trypanosoma melophagium]
MPTNGKNPGDPLLCCFCPCGLGLLPWGFWGAFLTPARGKPARRRFPAPQQAAKANRRRTGPKHIALTPPNLYKYKRAFLLHGDAGEGSGARSLPVPDRALTGQSMFLQHIFCGWRCPAVGDSRVRKTPYADRKLRFGMPMGKGGKLFMELYKISLIKFFCIIGIDSLTFNRPEVEW